MSATANVSSSSATSPFELDVVERLPPLPRALLEGRDTDLLKPLRFLTPGEMPAGEPPAVERGELARALAIANAGYGHPRAEDLAARLADPMTRVVVTGQQPGLLGGPLLTLTKMTAAVLWAEALEAAGFPAVAVFWVATEDHDWAETTTAAMFSPKGLATFDLGEDPAPLLPLGMRTLGEGVELLLEHMAEAAGGDDAAGRLRQAGRRYRPQARFGEAFSRLMIDVLGERAPLLLDSMLAEMKALQRPHLLRLVDRRRAFDEAVAAVEAETVARGYPLQVQPQPGVSPLFLVRGGERRRIEWEGEDRYRLRGLEGPAAPVAELRRIVEENPAAVSPGVLARPAIQDAVLGTTLQVLGPSELAYMAQARAAYGVLEVAAPWTTLRPQALVVDARQADHLRELGVTLGELASWPVDEIVAARLGDDVVGPVRAGVDELLEELGRATTAVDPTLEKPWRKTRDQIGRALDQLASKVAAAVARRHDVWRRRLEKLAETSFPGGKPQERVVSVGSFDARYGPELAKAFLGGLGRDPRRLHVLEMGAGGGRGGER